MRNSHVHPIFARILNAVAPHVGECSECGGNGSDSRPYQLACSARHPGPFCDHRGYYEKTEVGPIPCTRVIDFSCRVCGVQCPITGDDGAVCPEHCEDHDYVHQRGEGKHCRHCHAPEPEDWK